MAVVAVKMRYSTAAADTSCANAQSSSCNFEQSHTDAELMNSSKAL
jgi:hypothetical protein